MGWQAGSGQGRHAQARIVFAAIDVESGFAGWVGCAHPPTIIQPYSARNVLRVLTLLAGLGFGRFGPRFSLNHRLIKASRSSTIIYPATYISVPMVIRTKVSQTH